MYCVKTLHKTFGLQAIVTSRTSMVWHRLLSTENNSKNHFDIIIAGGGMVGTTLACTLGKNSKLADTSILLLEGGKEKGYTLSKKFSNRVSSLNPGTISLLQEIGAWDIIKSSRYAPVKKMQVWDGISDAMITFNHDDFCENVAYIVENDVLLSAVGQVAKNISNINILYEAKIQNYCLPDHCVDIGRITLENGSEYTCDLLLGCDGANSQVRKAMNVHYLNWNYKQMGVVATLKLDESCQNDTAWQRFLPTGPVAFLPLTENLSSLVWSTTPKQAKDLLKIPEEDFVDAVNHAVCSTYPESRFVNDITKTFDGVLRFLNCPSGAEKQLPPKIVGCDEGSRAAFPLGFGHSTSYIGKGVALVGDAAHRVHPLAGQGVNLGFGDVSCLSATLGKAVYAGSHLNNLNYLKEYETKRQKHNSLTMVAIEGLHRLYNTEFMPVILLRSLGLQATHSIGPLKRAIMSQAAV